MNSPLLGAFRICLCCLLLKSVRGVTVTLTGSADYAVVGQTFRFTCTVREDNSTLGYLSFTKDGIASLCIVFAGNCSQNGMESGYSCGCVSGQSDVYYMNISSVSVQRDEVTWTCERGSQQSNSITLPVFFGPPGVNITGNHDVFAPEVLTLTCTTNGHVKPTPTLTWRNSTDGAVLSGTSPVTVGSSLDGGFIYRSTQSIITRWYQDGDTIVCEGRNPRIQSQQTVTDSVVLDISYAPVISIEPPGPVRVQTESDLVVNCSAVSNPGNPTVSWYTGDTLVSQNNVLKIQSTSTRDSGLYSCRATVMSEKYGNLSSTSSVQVVVTAKSCSQEVSSTSTFGSGFAAGFGAMVAVDVVILSVIFMYRKRLFNKEKEPIEASHIYQNTSLDAIHPDQAEASNVHDESQTQRSEYAELEGRDLQPPNTYEKITTHKTT